MTRIESIRKRLAVATPDATPEDEYARSLQDREDLRDLLELYDVARKVLHQVYVAGSLRMSPASRPDIEKLNKIIQRFEEPDRGPYLGDPLLAPRLEDEDSPVGDEGAE